MLAVESDNCTFVHPKSAQVEIFDAKGFKHLTFLGERISFGFKEILPVVGTIRDAEATMFVGVPEWGLTAEEGFFLLQFDPTENTYSILDRRVHGVKFLHEYGVFAVEFGNDDHITTMGIVDPSDPSRLWEERTFSVTNDGIHSPSGELIVGSKGSNQAKILSYSRDAQIETVEDVSVYTSSIGQIPLVKNGDIYLPIAIPADRVSVSSYTSSEGYQYSVALLHYGEKVRVAISLRGSPLYLVDGDFDSVAIDGSAGVRAVRNGACYRICPVSGDLTPDLKIYRVDSPWAELESPPANAKGLGKGLMPLDEQLPASVGLTELETRMRALLGVDSTHRRDELEPVHNSPLPTAHSEAEVDQILTTMGQNFQLLLSKANSNRQERPESRTHGVSLFGKFATQNLLVGGTVTVGVGLATTMISMFSRSYLTDSHLLADPSFVIGVIISLIGTGLLIGGGSSWFAARRAAVSSKSNDDQAARGTA